MQLCLLVDTHSLYMIGMMCVVCIVPPRTDIVRCTSERNALVVLYSKEELLMYQNLVIIMVG